MTTQHLLDQPGYRHEALFYAGLDGFVAAAVPFLQDGLAAGEPAFVAAPQDELEALRDEFRGSEGIRFADMAVVGKNPACIIAAWHEFVDAHAGTGRRLRGIGQPIFAARSTTEIGECQRHEALLNVAFKVAPPLWLVCPYDTATLPPDVIAAAHHSHPHTSGHTHGPAAHYDEAELLRSVFAGPWPEPPDGTTAFDIAATGEISAVRRFATEHAARLGVPAAEHDDVALIVSELISNAVRHGGGRGVLHVWRDGDELVLQSRNRGALGDPLVGRLRPGAGQPDGRGLWIINQLCDLLQIRAQQGDVVLTASRRIGEAAN
jgi:anti-sigma regulatory factor (Ser/Thr protein kinase)